jgi:hypothetical protein
MNKFYVYAHYKTGEKDIPFYIGKGHENRAYNKKLRNTHWNNTVKKYGYEVRLLAGKLSESDAFWLEIKLIGMFGRADLELGPLVNRTNGGEGTSGRIVSVEQREFYRTLYSGKPIPTYVKEKIRLSTKGKPKAESAKKNMSKSLEGNKNGLGNKSRTGQINSPEANRRGGKTLKIVWAKRIADGYCVEESTKDILRKRKLGTKHICNLITNEHRVINTGDILPDGWRFGMPYRKRAGKPIQTPKGIFESQRAAAIAHNCTPSSITYRLNYVDGYEYLPKPLL